MIIGKVIDRVWCTRKDDSMVGLKFLTIGIMDGEDKGIGRMVVAVDLIGAGIGETVLVSQGSASRNSCGLKNSPVDSVVVGIVDDKMIEEDEAI